MEAVYLDTHVAIWLYAGQKERFPDRVRSLLEASEKKISPAVLLELQILKEIGKIEFKVDRFLKDLSNELDIQLCTAPFSSVILESSRISWTRDPFDRIIVAQAANDEARLITRDRIILDNYKRAFWK